MELYEAIRKRRTVREFLKKEVDFETVKRILEAGNLAPHLESQPQLELYRPEMYGYAMPRQYTMRKDAPYVVIPVFQC